MRLLLDTHVLLWLAEGVELTDASRDAIDEVASSEGVAVSAISFWETAMLQTRGRLALSKPVSEWRRQVLSAPGIVEVEVAGDVAIESVYLPGSLHSDPADRILAATARMRGLRLATRDKRLLDYGRAGYLEVLMV